MRTIPVLAALLVATAAFSIGSAAVTPTPGDATPSDQSMHDQVPEVQNASFDRLVMADVEGTFTIDEMTVDEVQTDQGTVEDVTLEEATVTLENATVVVSNVSSEEGDVGHAFVTVEEGTVTVEEATATANGAEFTLDGMEASVENETMTGDLQDADANQMRVNPDELRELVEGASVENLSIDGVSADPSIDLVSVEGVEANGNTGFAMFGEVALESFEDASISAESASVEDGTLVLEGATMSVEDARATVDIGVVGMNDDVRVLDNVEVEIDGPVDIERDQLRIPLW